MNKIVIYLDTNHWHIAQIITGFLLLKKQGKADIQFRYGKYRRWNNIFKVTINDIPVVYDIADTATIDMPEYNAASVYFKRMCLKADLQTHPKLQPLGFNYLCYTRGWDFFEIYAPLMPFSKKLGLQRLRYLPLLPKFLKIEDSVVSSHYEAFENANTARPFVIQFSSRLWSAQNTDNPVWIEERRKVNGDRIDLARLLRQEFRGMYFGGVQESAIARELAPDLIIDKKFYDKKTYLKNLKKSCIGIVTPGLEDSIAWKFGEYVAAGLAILCTPEFVKYQLPGNFEEGKNFLVFSSNDDCVQKIKELQQNKAALTNMMEANIQYYRDHLRPDQLVAKTIAAVNDHRLSAVKS